MKQKILYGGSFDPPTLAHRRVLEIAKAAFPLAEIVVIPAGAPPHKEGRELRPAEARLAMARLAFGDIPGLRVSEEECRRAGPSFTVDTLRAQWKQWEQWEDSHSLSEEQQPQLFLLMGSDSTLSLPSWREPHEILKLAQILTVPRPGFDPEGIGQLPGLSPDERIAIKKGVLPQEAPAISSTEARALLASGQPVEDVVPAPVLAFIRERGLYTSPSSPQGAPPPL
jgi:nicotinate-nucleotide adenylyltransferase